jgi:hypothetical protein
MFPRSKQKEKEKKTGIQQRLAGKQLPPGADIRSCAVTSTRAFENQVLRRSLYLERSVLLELAELSRYDVWGDTDGYGGVMLRRLQVLGQDEMLKGEKRGFIPFVHRCLGACTYLVSHTRAASAMAAEEVKKKNALRFALYRQCAVDIFGETFIRLFDLTYESSHWLETGWMVEDEQFRTNMIRTMAARMQNALEKLVTTELRAKGAVLASLNPRAGYSTVATLERENRQLVAEVARLEQRVAELSKPQLGRSEVYGAENTIHMESLGDDDAHLMFSLPRKVVEDLTSRFNLRNSSKLTRRPNKWKALLCWVHMHMCDDGDVPQPEVQETKK